MYMIDLTQEDRALLRLRVEQALYEVDSGNQIPSADQGMLTAVQSNPSETTLTELQPVKPQDFSDFLQYFEYEAFCSFLCVFGLIAAVYAVSHVVLHINSLLSWEIY